MATLVISDLHLGARSRRDVLRRPAALRRLVAAAADAETLVLLGDTIELLEGRGEAALRDAAPVLSAIGQALGPRRRVLLLPGNHDHGLIAGWLRARQRSGRPLAREERVPNSASSQLRMVTRALAPARVEVRYPAAYLGHGVWVHHGHYLDRHLVRRRDGENLTSPEAYERTLGAAATRITGGAAAALPGVIGDAVDQAARIATKSAVIARPAIAAVPGAGLLAPLSAGLLGYQFRRSGLPAMAAVADHLSVEAEHVVFGHVHRAGPLPGDDPAHWQVGDRRLWNSGCWVYEPLLLAATQPPHPYWPGGALWVERGDITPVGLLDDLTQHDLS